ncbi:MAG TPA: hypothetical protein VGJ84_05910, partial [Polyangiaceae bacterium]
MMQSGSMEGTVEPLPEAQSPASPAAADVKAGGWRGRKVERLLRFKWMAIAVMGLPALVIALWLAVHRFDWAGPLLANSLRAVIGSNNVTRLEEFSYAVEDRWNRIWRRREPPKAYWGVPSSRIPQPPPTSATVALPSFQPRDPGPVHKLWSAPGDGVWVPIRDPRRPNEAPYLFKTLLHPDRVRSWGELFVVAVDLRRVRVYAVAGSQEPKADNKT